MSAWAIIIALFVWAFWFVIAAAVVIACQALANWIKEQRQIRRLGRLADRMREDCEVAYLESIPTLPTHPRRMA